MQRETERLRETGRERREGYVARVARIVRRIIGAPDYAAYLEHCRLAGHAPACGETEFVRQYFEDKARRPRCC